LGERRGVEVSPTFFRPTWPARGRALLPCPADPVSAQQARCLAGKTSCMARDAAGLLKCETLAAQVSEAGADAGQADGPEHQGLRRRGCGEVYRRRRSDQGMLREAPGEGPERLPEHDRLDDRA